MSPPDVVKKAVSMRSSNRCAFPGCGQPLVVEVDGSTTIVGEFAHIVGRSVQGPRGHLDVDPEDRERPENYLLLCPTHHTLIDKTPLTYSVPVLRAMKEQHERACVVDLTETNASEHVEETLHSTMLWIQALPSSVFSATTDRTFEQVLKGLRSTRDLTPFVLVGGRLWAFHDLRDASGPFADVVDRSTTEGTEAEEAWADPDQHRLYVQLLNRSMTGHLSRQGVRFDRHHRRYYFAASGVGVETTWKYRTKSGRSQVRKVVRQARSKDGSLKPEWWHLAVRVRFEQVGPRSWYVTLRPEFHLTKDGKEPFESQRIGRRITRKKSTVYNEGYLDLVHFWRGVISEEKPHTVLHAGQPIVFETHLLDAQITWPGVPRDEVTFEPDPFPENLFTLAELDEALNFDDESFDYELEAMEEA